MLYMPHSLTIDIAYNPLCTVIVVAIYIVHCGICFVIIFSLMLLLAPPRRRPPPPPPPPQPAPSAISTTVSSDTQANDAPLTCGSAASGSMQQAPVAVAVTNGSVVEHVHMNSDPNATASEVGKPTKSNQKLEANGMML